MPRRIHLAPHLTNDELQKRYRATTDPIERSHWHFLWLLAGGMTATAVAVMPGYCADWIGQIARRYNTEGPESMRDRRHALCAGQPNLPTSQLAELEAAVASPHPEGDLWCGRTVAQWLGERLGRRVIPISIETLWFGVARSTLEATRRCWRLVAARRRWRTTAR